MSTGSAPSAGQETRCPLPCPGGKACPGSRFTDMPPVSNWAHNAIDFTVAHKLFAGTSDTTFEPSARLTRAMIVMILYRLEGEPAAAAESAFTDVRSGAWYAGAIGWAAGSGIVNGVGGGRFDPNGLATREQTAAILYRYARFKGCDLDACGDLSAFADAGSVSAFGACAHDLGGGRAADLRQCHRRPDASRSAGRDHTRAVCDDHDALHFERCPAGARALTAAATVPAVRGIPEWFFRSGMFFRRRSAEIAEIPARLLTKSRPPC